MDFPLLKDFACRAGCRLSGKLDEKQSLPSIGIRLSAAANIKELWAFARRFAKNGFDE
jgi:hypothetical protein